MDQRDTLTATMAISPRLLPYFEPGKIVGLILPGRAADYFHVDTASWSDVNGENRHTVALSFMSPDRIPVKAGIPCFRVGN